MRIKTFPQQSWSSRDPKIQAEIKREADTFSQFADKKVTIRYIACNDWSKSAGMKQGRIKWNEKENRHMFLPKGNRYRDYNMTLGMYHGFLATLTITEIELGWIKKETT